MQGPDKAGSQLNVLGWFYLLFAASGLLSLSVVPVLKSVLRKAIVFVEEQAGPTEEVAMLQALADTLDQMHLYMVVLAAVHLIVYLLTAYALWKRKWFGICFANAVLTCLAFPLGTVLGIVSIVVLSKPESKALFGREGQPPSLRDA